MSISPSLARLVLLGSVLMSSSCARPGPYGFARTYQPLPSEKLHYAEAHNISYQDLVREPNAYKDEEISWFGVVRELSELPDRRTRMLLTLRTHQPRHLCANESRTSCRVTVSEAALGIFTIEVELNDDERSGKDRVWIGSLLKVYGVPRGEYSQESGPVFDVVYYRHWPVGTYVTTAQRAGMRR